MNKDFLDTLTSIQLTIDDLTALLNRLPEDERIVNTTSCLEQILKVLSVKESKASIAILSKNLESAES